MCKSFFVCFKLKAEMWQLRILKHTSAINDKVVQTVMEDMEAAFSENEWDSAGTV